jgi:hypothetical protein
MIIEGRRKELHLWPQTGAWVFNWLIELGNDILFPKGQHLLA